MLSTSAAAAWANTLAAATTNAGSIADTETSTDAVSSRMAVPGFPPSAISGKNPSTGVSIRSEETKPENEQKG